MKIIHIFFWCLLALSFTSCEADDLFDDDAFEDYYEGGLSIRDFESKLIGRAWTGNLKQYAPNGEPIFSTFFFGSHGEGVEYQYYSRDGAKCAEFPLRWHTEYCVDCGARSLVLDYGHGDLSYMDEVYFRGPYTLTGIYFYTSEHRGVHFNLDMER